MAYWMLHTCVKFVEMSYPTGSHLRLIRGRACRSAVGRVSKTGQDVVIGPGCRKVSSEGEKGVSCILYIVEYRIH